jgi:hypothetical protein
MWMEWLFLDYYSFVFAISDLLPWNEWQSTWHFIQKRYSLAVVIVMQLHL